LGIGAVLLSQTPTSVEQFESRNSTVYDDDSVARSYAAESALQPAEVAIFSQLQDLLKNRPVLDIGVGGGRTTDHLLRLSSDYVGVDYSARMVEVAKQRYPQVSFEVADARFLQRFADSHFGLVLFSFNGIDYIHHEGRLQALKEMWRKVALGGWLVFSSHNRAAFQPEPSFQFSLHPFRLWSEWLRTKHLRNGRKLEQHTAEYAIVNDGAHGSRLLTYYIDHAQQVRQLQSVGIKDTVEIYDRRGKLIEPNDKCDSPWIYYAIQKTS
jgi:SAM-dependent methyltransferase